MASMETMSLTRCVTNCQRDLPKCQCESVQCNLWILWLVGKPCSYAVSLTGMNFWILPRSLSSGTYTNCIPTNDCVLRVVLTKVTPPFYLCDLLGNLHRFLQVSTKVWSSVSFTPHISQIYIKFRHFYYECYNFVIYCSLL